MPQPAGPLPHLKRRFPQSKRPSPTRPNVSPNPSGVRPRGVRRPRRVARGGESGSRQIPQRGTDPAENAVELQVRRDLARLMAIPGISRLVGHPTHAPPDLRSHLEKERIDRNVDLIGAIFIEQMVAIEVSVPLVKDAMRKVF